LYSQERTGHKEKAGKTLCFPRLFYYTKMLTPQRPNTQSPLSYIVS
jgi:hypothetical protein